MGRLIRSCFSPPLTAAEPYRNIERIKPSSLREIRRNGLLHSGRQGQDYRRFGPGKGSSRRYPWEGGFGEGCLTGQPRRLATAAALTESA
jgi:hypothetical protein